jgi:serine/threonine protein kinase
MPGTIMGTVGYMAPEQVKGEKADARSDIFAFGCVLYEMLSGHRPFNRDTSAEVMTAILRENPPSVAECGVEVAQEVERTVARCLEKDPERRFQSASDLSFALHEIAPFSPSSACARSGIVARRGWKGTSFDPSRFFRLPTSQVTRSRSSLPTV